MSAVADRTESPSRNPLMPQQPPNVADEVSVAEPQQQQFKCRVCDKPATRTCPACGTKIVYCSGKCQSEDWPVHKFDCVNPGLVVRGPPKQAKQGDPNIEDADDLRYYIQQTAKIINPVLACIALSVLWVKLSAIGSDYRPSQSSLSVYQSSPTDSITQQVGGGLQNALVILAEIVGMTLVFVGLFKYGCFRVLYGFLFLIVVFMLGLMSYLLLLNLLQVGAIPLDQITFYFMLYNFSVGGLVAIFSSLLSIPHASSSEDVPRTAAVDGEKPKPSSANWSPMWVQQVYLVIMSSLMAFALVGLDAWTTWALLAILAIWDLIAVLCPFGPLKLLIESSRAQNREIPALLYSVNMLWMMASVDQSPEEIELQISPSKQSTSDAEYAKQLAAAEMSDQEVGAEERSGLKLGLGDFVFYSVLVSRTTAASDWTTTLACVIGILTGLTLTIYLLAIYKKALPALPISIAIGLVFYFVGSIALSPLVANLNINGLMV